MSTFSVPVVRVGAVERHPNADTLSLTEVRGCPVVLRTGSFVEGDLAVYVPVDAVVDTTVPELAFLAVEGKASVRIRAKRLRGTFSMGLLVAPPVDAQEGDDLAERLRICKYEEPEPVSMAGEQARAPPLLVPTYELEAWRHYGPTLFDAGEEVVVSEKLHGTNGRFVVDAAGNLHVGSHRTWKQLDGGTTVWARVAEQYFLREKLGRHPGLVFFGEVYGSGVQDLTYGHANGRLSLAFFDVFDSRTGDYLSHGAAEALLNELALPTVPVLYRGPLDVALLSRLAEEDSVHGGIREGVVVRPVVERVSMAVRCALRVVSERYLLRKGGTEHH
jgi:RNA ligase (TIGR02306 family)